MFFDLVRAWKDEAYRHKLNKEQLHTLPANPAGELDLSDNDLEAVCGGTHNFARTVGYSTDYGAGAAATAFVPRDSVRSYALICDVNVYSIDIEVLDLELITIGECTSTVCGHCS